MLSPYINSVVPYYVSLTPILLLLRPYIIIVRLTRITLWPTRITLWPHGLLYIERRFCHLYHPRIFHLCNVLEVAPSKWLISKALISLFFYFWSWLHNTELQGTM